jgi:SAM-dependent methyltransferase
VGYLGRVYHETDRLNRERILELCEPMSGARLLDLGCADGAFTLEIARRLGADEMHGVEFVEELAALATERGLHVTSHDLNTPLPFEDASFDVIHSNQVIEHLEKTDVFLKQIRRVLKPTGYAIVSTNNLSSWHNVFSLMLGMQPTPCHVSDEVVVGNRFDPKRGAAHAEKGFTHLRVFAYQGLKELLELHGFAIDEFVTTGYYPLPPSIAGVLCRVDPRHGAYLVTRVRRAPGRAHSSPR